MMTTEEWNDKPRGTTRLDQLKAMREAVRDGAVITSDMLAAVPHHPEVPTRKHSLSAAFDRDMNAALALFAALLPGWIWGRQVNGAMFIAKRPHTFRVQTGPGIDPARALLLATLEARIAKEER